MTDIDHIRKTVPKSELLPAFTLPSLFEAEQSVLAALINNSSQLNDIIDYFNPEYFYDDDNRILAESILSLHNENTTIDQITIFKWLQDKKMLSDTLNMEFINSFSGKGYILNKQHLFILIEYYMWREEWKIGGTIQQKVQNSEDCFIINEYGIASLERLDIRDQIFKENFKAVLDKVIDEMSKDTVTYLKSSLNGYIRPEMRNIWLIAGVRGCGKSKIWKWLSKEWFQNNQDVNLFICDFEESDKAVAMGLLSAFTAIEYNKIKYNKLNEFERNELNQVKAFLSGQNIEFSNQREIDKICNGFKKFCKKYPNDSNILIVDNIGAVDIQGIGRTEQEDKIMNKFVQLRDKTNGLIILIHHMTKQVTDKDNKSMAYRPTIDHVRGSGRLADYANVIYLINFLNLYPDIVTQEKIRKSDMVVNDKHIIENLFILECAKMREGKTFVLRMQANLDNNQFKII